jgi:hypothetical protein
MGPTCSRLATEVHHVVEVADGGDDSMDNLISICELCHRHLTAVMAASRGGQAAGGSTAASTGGPRSSSAPSPRRRRDRVRVGDRSAPVPRVIYLG